MRGILRKLRTALITGSELVEKCQGYKCRRRGIWTRQITAYEDDERNWACYCKSCQIKADEYWQEMWNDYYNSVY